MVATKDQERQALQQIRKIVEDLGEDSYIGMAFEGVWKIAEDNIENDFGMSCQSYIDMLHEEEEKTAMLLDSYGAKSRCLMERIKEFEDELCRKESIIRADECRIEEMERELVNANECKFNMAVEIRDLKDKLDFAHNDIVKLKAKLYDLMFPSA